MSGQSKPFDVNSYRAILAQNDPEYVYKTAETQRKCTILSFEEACKSLDNASACKLLSHNLNKYTQTVYKDGSNIYNDLLHKTYPELAIKRQFKLPNSLPKTDLSVFLKDIPCSEEGNKLKCRHSEQITKCELDQLTEAYVGKKTHSYVDQKSVKWSNRNKNTLSLEERFKNLDKLQGKDNLNAGQSLEESFKNLNKLQGKQPTNGTSKGEKREVKCNFPGFSTAQDELQIQMSKAGIGGRQYSDENMQGEGNKKKLGSRRTGKSKFVCPLLSSKSSEETIEETINPVIRDERLKNIEPKMVELIMAEIMDKGPTITWNDIAGLQFAKSAIQEAVVWPLLRPDIFTGLRRPPKGILLFGPPGTGKTLIGKCVASQSKSTFFSISASSLTSKWIGDGEKMVRALFQVARVHQPAVIFIDEVDSLLTQRSDTEHESSRRIKTEFLVQLDGATTDSEERLLVIGATNRPQELDEAARRRFVKRLYIPLPEYDARVELLKKLMSTERHSLTENDFNEISRLSDGYSGADIKNLCSDAALEPIRSIDFSQIEDIQASQVRSLDREDFGKALRRVRPSVSQADLVQYLSWDSTYGCGINPG